MDPKSDIPKRPRNIIFFGETGSGKSSAINLLLDSGTSALVSNDTRPCTQTSARYGTTLNGTNCILWDTRGLGEGRSWLQYFFGGGSEKDLKTFLKERYRSRELDLLVFCVRGSRVVKASVNYYNTFCAVTRRLAAPVVIVVTQLDRENTENWWDRNSSSLRELGMEFDGHACITTLPKHSRLTECKEKLADLITRDRRWEAKECGSYFGSPVQKLTSSVPLRKAGLRWNLLRATKGRVGVDNGGISRYPSNDPSPPSSAPSLTDSSYHTADSPVESTASSPTVGPPTPHSATTPIRVPRNIDTNLPGASNRPEPSSEETPSTSSSLYSMFHPSSHSSCTSRSEVNLESCIEDGEDYCFRALPFPHSTATVRKRQTFATCSGAFGDIWECDLISGESSRIVAVKAVRTNNNDNDDLRKRLRRELRVWEKLQHRNIVPLLGVVSGFGRLSSPVSPWFQNGSLSHYMVDHQMSLSRKHRVLGDIAVGLRHLHGQGVVHGDLHSDNVLIDDDGTACLTDFGLSFISDFVGTSYLKSGVCGAVRFADPELVKQAYSSQDDMLHPTGPCDIYSFGGLMLHVLSGKKPYEGVPQQVIFMTVLRGERPHIPTHNKHVTESHKLLIQLCWDPDERKRPSADNLVRRYGRQ